MSEFLVTNGAVPIHGPVADDRVLSRHAHVEDAIEAAAAIAPIPGGRTAKEMRDEFVSGREFAVFGNWKAAVVARLYDAMLGREIPSWPGGVGRMGRPDTRGTG